MATQTLDVMFPEFGRTLGAFVGSFTATTAINADNLVLSTELRGAGFVTDDDLNDFWIRITSDANIGVIRHIGDYAQSTGTITVSGPVLADDSSDLATFEVYRWSPTRILNALNDARQTAFPALHKRVVDRTTTMRFPQTTYARPTSIVRNHVTEIRAELRIAAKTFSENIANDLNVDMEGGTITDDWTAETGITISKEQETSDPDNTMVFSGQFSMKIDATAVDKTVTLSITDFGNYEGEELNGSIWVYSRVASIISAHLQVDSGTAVDGTQHTGSGWERLTVTTVLGSTPLLKFGLRYDNNAGSRFQSYADEAILTAGYTEPVKLVGDLMMVWAEEADNIRLGGVLALDRNLAIEGRGLLSSVSSGTDTMEIDENNKRLLYAYAGVEFFQGDQHTENQGQFNQVERRLSRYQQQINSGVGAMASQPTRRLFSTQGGTFHPAGPRHRVARVFH
tara:strand:- start:6472 stop:7833 length:1362 start_codon:yes stop_codon:yes gene_type:complete